MKIQNDGGQLPGPAISTNKTAARVVNKERLESRASDGTDSVDSVQTSGAAQQLEADPARMERLREAVRNGTYKVPALEVSARIIDAHLDKSSKRD